ncbi:hypothetical protein HPB52_010733 [Rhipicephalus sanguineus]|uniref:Uncharacterized protein n=1 Tax=Rhipicephalus sanguineus TaxID=34632 RepID=A0A9D4T9H2_RHISA|nr:hypothetical protein HPB52_010733 [Rhipicephalus sanguineus]
MKCRVLSAASIRTSPACQAEQLAIALALLRSDRVDIYTNSTTALRAFSTGAVCENVARALDANGDELAQARARGLGGCAGHWGAGVPDGTGNRGAPLLHTKDAQERRRRRGADGGTFTK